MRSRLPAPASLSRPGLVLALVSVGLYFIARSTGAGWDIVLLCGLGAVLLTGAIWPGVALVGVRATAAAPRDATVGRPLPVDLALRGRARGLQLRLSIDAESETGWVHADAPGAGHVTDAPGTRGVFTEVFVEVRSSSPLGLVGWRRWVVVPLARPVEVAPRSIPTRYDSSRGSDREAASRPRSSAAGPELTRGVREYVDGDPIRLVHWPATARTGSVMVRELEGPQRPRLVVVVDLSGATADAEIAASRASGLALAALTADAFVDLATVEPDGPRTAAVQTGLEVGRRLARAVPGPPAPGPVPPGTEVRHVRAGSLE